MIKFIAIAAVAAVMSTGATASTYNGNSYGSALVERYTGHMGSMFEHISNSHGASWQGHIRQMCGGEGVRGCRHEIRRMVRNMIRAHRRGHDHGAPEVTPSAVPLPAGGALLLTAIGGFALMRRKRNAKA